MWLSLKKIIDNRRLVAEKTTTAYQQQFRHLFTALNSNPDYNEWMDIYKKLVYWELEMEKSDSPEMQEILQNQKSEANTEFFKFISRNYAGWVNPKSKEGTSKVTVKAGSVTKTISLVVESPLVGLWIRRGDAKSGLTLNVVQGTDGLSGYVVRPPDETSLPGLRSELRTKNVDAQFKCLQRTWGNGLKKWASMKRIGVDRWAMGDLAKPLTLSHCNPILRECSSVCIEGRSEYLNDYELTLTDTSHATIRRTTTTKGDPQQWERITEMPDGGAPTALQDAAPSLATSAGALSVPQPPEATSKPTPKASGSIRIRCKNGEKAYPYKLGCQCGEHDPTGDKAESIDMPGPCSYAAKGDGPYCVFPADCKYEK